jgi:hypothetical protein
VSLILLFRAGGAQLKTGYGVAGLVGSGADAMLFVERGFGKVGLLGAGAREAPISAAVAVANRYPTVTLQVAFTSQPLAVSPTFEDLSERMREVSSQRGRSYEFDRMETGTLGTRLSNNDAELTPENTASQYAPIKSTRPLRALLQWEVPYPMFWGITEGFPQTYQSLGKDALVQLRANDPFYALNNTRFTPGSTTLTTALTVAAAGNLENVYVANTGLPMPQTPPFQITVLGDDPLTNETMTVLSIGTGVWWTQRGDATFDHSAGATVTTPEVSFGEAYSGERIQAVLEAVGFDSSWYDLDDGQSLIAPSSDLAAVSPLEHINLITEAEFGRFFVSKDGYFMFRDRHSIILDHLAEVFTFRDGADTSADEVPFFLNGDLAHSEEKLFNRVKITIQGGAYDGQIVDMLDQPSIDEHFERIFERTFPYANLNDADSAARFVLSRNSEAQLRLPGISVKPAFDPSVLWPKILAREIGDRLRFLYQPEGGGDPVDMDIAVDGISHAIRPGDHVVTFQCTEVDSTQYWILGLAGYTELSQTTKVGF